MSWSIEVNRNTIATAIGLFTSTGFFYASIATSLWASPALVLPPGKRSKAESSEIASRPVTPASHLARQWKLLFASGKKVGLLSSIVGAASWAYVASALPADKSNERNLYIAGALFAFSVIPFTAILMRKIIADLTQRAETAESGEVLKEEKGLIDPASTTGEVVKQWAWLNFVRGCVPLLGLACVVRANLA